MKTVRKILGDKGEKLAAEYLKRKGYTIRGRNYQKTWGEIDIIASSPDETLVFVEVKTVTGKNPGISAEDLLTSSKLYKLVKICSFYSNDPSLQKYIKEDTGWRIDAITLTIDEKDCDIRHYENIV